MKDLPPSYSKLDLTNLGISVQDYLNPPPTYLDLVTDSLQYLDLEQGHNRLAKLSFCNEDGSPPRLTRLSVARSRIYIPRKNICIANKKIFPLYYIQ